jgi:hypothetical protein
LSRLESQNEVSTIVFKEGRMFLGLEYGAIIEYLKSTSTMVEMALHM